MLFMAILKSVKLPLTVRKHAISVFLSLFFFFSVSCFNPLIDFTVDFTAHFEKILCDDIS